MRKPLNRSWLLDFDYLVMVRKLPWPVLMEVLALNVQFTQLEERTCLRFDLWPRCCSSHLPHFRNFYDFGKSSWAKPLAILKKWIKRVILSPKQFFFINICKRFNWMSIFYIYGKNFLGFIRKPLNCLVELFTATFYFGQPLSIIKRWPRFFVEFFCNIFILADISRKACFEL